MVGVEGGCEGSITHKESATGGWVYLDISARLILGRPHDLRLVDDAVGGQHGLRAWRRRARCTAGGVVSPTHPAGQTASRIFALTSHATHATKRLTAGWETPSAGSAAARLLGSALARPKGSGSAKRPATPSCPSRRARPPRERCARRRAARPGPARHPSFGCRCVICAFERDERKMAAASLALPPPRSSAVGRPERRGGPEAGRELGLRGPGTRPLSLSLAAWRDRGTPLSSWLVRDL
jgi:hypothetical protein